MIVFCGLELNAQQINAVEITNQRKAYYQSILNNNSEVVKFLESSLTENGLPKMMRNLALIESGFNKNAVSSAKAAGIWQLMEEHAKHYDLKSEDRFDVYRSTQVAVKSLKNLYGKYGNWITVVAAYNCGEGNIKKAMDKANSDRYGKFYVYLPSETILHVQKFMEACTVTKEIDFLLANYNHSQENESKEIRFVPINQNSDLVSTEINAAFNIDVIAQVMEIDLIDLFRWNPELQEKLYTDGEAMLFLPSDVMTDFHLIRNFILNKSLQLNDSEDE